MEAQSVLNDINKVLNKYDDFEPLHEPLFIGNEIDYVKDCINTGWVSSVGKYVDQFEIMLAEYTGARYAVAVSNGTAALHLSLEVLGIGAEDEVLIPSLSFIATANAVVYSGATPHFIDINKETLGVDAVKLDEYLQSISIMKNKACFNKITDKPIKAIIPMHTFGHSVEMDSLLEIAHKYNLLVVEDAAESLGSYYKEQHTGTLGDISAISFNGNKIITTGGGGAVITNDKTIAEKAKYLSTTAKRPHKWEFYHDEIGYNYRMPNINAALGCAQLENINLYVKRKRDLALKYKEAFQNNTIVDFYSEHENSNSNYWLNTLILKKPDIKLRNQILEILNSNNIMARPAWNLLHTLPMYNECPKMDLTVSENLLNSIINIPSSVKLG